MGCLRDIGISGLFQWRNHLDARGRARIVRRFGGVNMITTKEIAEVLSLLDDTKNLMKLVATAGDAIDDGCCDDRDGDGEQSGIPTDRKANGSELL